MIPIKKYKSIFLVFIIMALSVNIAACGDNTTSDTISQQDTESVSYSNTQAGIYDSEDAAVVVSKNLEEKTVQFQNITSSRRYTLSYDGTTTIYDKNNQALSMEQLKEGSIVTVRFYKPTKSIAYVKENSECISMSDVSNYTMDLGKGIITVGSDVYNISGQVVVISDGHETDMMEVNQEDVISIWGYKNMIYGIRVEKGHGYLRLENEDYFVGGWIDVGSKVIKKITEDMLIVVPEGTYSVNVSNKGTTATQQITFNRNEEMAWDLGDIEITVVQKGTIIFTLTPLTATVIIDGKTVNTSNPVTLDYGLHRMQISADGYDTVAQYIKVAEPTANISVELEKSQEESSTEKDSAESDTASSSEEEESSSTSKEEESSTLEESSTSEESSKSEEESSETASDSSEVAQASTKYKVYINAPEGVEAYLDGNYIGITPVSFNKAEGSYVVSLRKNGYQTRSYTLQIDSEEKDVNYTFTELIPLE
jgi:hypothetical protein